MYPNVHTCAIDLDGFENLKAVADVVYNPLRTELVMKALDRGIPAKGGLYMLTMQGIKAAEHFFSKETEKSLISMKKTKMERSFSDQWNIVVLS